MAEPHDLNEEDLTEDDGMMNMQQVSMAEHSDEDVKMILDNSGNSIEESNQNELVVLDNNILEEALGPSKVSQELNDKENNVSEESKIESASAGTSGNSFIFKCVFCERILSPCDNPKLLECLHNACNSCINSKLEEQQNVNQAGIKENIECAACNLACDVDKLLDNQFLLELHNLEDNASTKSIEIKCSSCSDDAVAVSFCVDCAEYICESCVQAHQRLKITKDHTIKPKDEGYAESQSGTNGSNSVTLHCNIHPNEKLSLFCENCDRLTCRDCQLLEHRDHKYKFTHEIASDTRKLISTMLKDVTYKRSLLNTAMKVINDRQGLIVEKKQALVDEITQLVVKLTNTINVRGKQLVSRLNEVCEHKQKTLQEKKVALDQLSKMTDHCIEFTQHAVENGSDMALLLSKRQVTYHLQRIKCKRADIPNPEIPVRIHLALDKVPDLIKGLSSVISTIGQIVVDGRVYPTPTSSPATSLPPHGSPSPVHTRSPLQESPINHQIQYQQQQQQQQQNQLQSQLQQQTQQQLHQQHQQQLQQVPMAFQQSSSQSSFQPHRMPPPYTQYQPQNLGQNVNIIPNLGPKMPSNLNPNISPMTPSIPISLAQHLQQNLQKMPIIRNNMGRAILPLSRLGNNGLNHQQQQQVSSSTHPQGLVQDRDNLRGLLQPINNNAVYVQTGPNQYQAVQPQFAQQYQNRFPGSHPAQQQFRPQGILRGGAISITPTSQAYRMPGQRNSLPNQELQSPNALQSAKWHIPQQNTVQEPPIGSHLSNITINRAQVIPGMNDNFKIMLKSQNLDTKPSTVSSTIPKTPSPNHIQGKSDTERNLDKYCQDSVNDLMATIAKLDSNGVQVLAEGRAKTGGSPQVDSSTDDLSGPTRQIKNDSNENGKDDPNEDWCAVCMDGGELVCCDKCPKVFHQFCHIPNLTVEESDTWQCLLCVNFADMPEGERMAGELSRKERKIAERLVLELYCQYEESLAFRELIGPDNVEYHSVIKNPIALDTLRHKVDWSTSDHYTNLEDLIKDVRLMFNNAYAFNEVGTVVYNNAKTLENFFNQQLEKLIPQYSDTSDDYILQPPTKRLRRVIPD